MRVLMNGMDSSRLISNKNRRHNFDEEVFDIPLVTYSEHVSESKKSDQKAFNFEPLKLLKKYDNRCRNDGSLADKPSCDESLPDSKLSTEKIIRIAGERFIESCCQVVDIVSMLNNPFSASFSNFSDEDSKNMELVEFLLASAEKVGYHQFERASRLLNHCDLLSSDTGNPVQRLVYYFFQALREKIDRETGRMSLKGTAKTLEMVNLKHASLACHQKIPFFQVAQFTGIQAILELYRLHNSQKIPFFQVAQFTSNHVIDLEIRGGAHWAILMQALQARKDCPLELFKITAIGTTSKHTIEDTGKKLASFAKSMSIPFSFKAIMVPDILELNEDLFELDPQETVAIYSEYLLMSLISKPNRLQSLMKVLRNINPCVMVLVEIEANNNSPSFVNRFIESLIFFQCIFPCED